jgi:hypothetical protein
MFWDIETVPNVGVFWKASQKTWINPDNVVKEARICCICYKWEGHKRVFALQWDDGDDRKMIEEFIPIANQADELVCHGGDRFDIKWFHAQCLKYGLPGLVEPKTIDTLAWARKHFWLNSNRLDYIAKLLLGEGKMDTDFELWKDVLFDRDPKALAYMVEYCRQDVRVLEKVYHKLAPFAAPKTHAGVLDGGPKWSCAHCASFTVRRKKRRVTTKGSVQHSMVCKDCRRHYTISDTAYRDYERWRDFA